jgi:two-component system, chemotaxis family, response regulator WspF
MRIAIVNDIKVAVEVLKRIVASIPDSEIAWIAYNGKEAVEKCAQDLPDLILMDLVMPLMNGVEATEAIMKHTPCNILIVTSSVHSHISMVFKAMGFGALDVVRTPILDLNNRDFGGAELIKKIEKIGNLSGKIVKKNKNREDGGEGSFKEKKSQPPLLLIGSSTGGPSALTKILKHFPENPTFATIIIQHVDEEFAPSFAHWLGNQVSQNVQIAHDGMRLERGMVVLAGKSDHLLINASQRLEYSPHPLEILYRPSIDILFQSANKYWPNKSMAILLTGMGTDGAKGLKELKDSGWYTIAEHQDSCIVYGMPKAAIEMGGAADILNLSEIGPAILSFFLVKENHDCRIS